MGKVRPNYIKNSCDEIYRSFKDKISKDFEENKIFLDKYFVLSSKRLRNRMAGYLINLKNKEDKLIIAPKKEKKPRDIKRKRYGKAK